MSSNALGAFVKQQRTLLGLTQQQLANRIGAADRSYVTRLERGDIQRPSLEVREKLAEALEVDPLRIMVEMGDLTDDQIRAGEPVPVRYRELVVKLDLLTTAHLRMLEGFVNEMLREQQAQSKTGERRSDRNSLVTFR